MEGWNHSNLVRTYFHHSELQTEWAWELIGRSPLKGNERILDFGCGDGKITAALARLVSKGKATGVEISEKKLRFAKPKKEKRINFKGERIHVIARPLLAC